jgi:NTE family protein
MQKKTVNLALQGGGAHGAFTWGILDKFLERGCFIIEGISATSAGSMNAVVLAEGMMNGGNEGARQALYKFWKAMSDYGQRVGLTASTPLDMLLEPILGAPINFILFSTMTSFLSPYQFNPLNIHPIREVLQNTINIEKVKQNSAIKLFICATNVKTGKIRIFDQEELSIDAVLASACLPKLFQAVEIDNEYYWDGGYLGNPAIFPLIYNTASTDIVILHTVPIVSETLPNTVMEIDARLREISFNSSLMREMRAIAFVSKLVGDGWIKSEYEDKLKKIHVHCVRADKALEGLPLSSVYVPDWDFLLRLRDLGREEADVWLAQHFDAIGNETTINFNEWL